MTEDETFKKLEALITNQGIKVSGIGILCENTKDLIERLDRIAKILFFLEQRQQRMEEQNKQILDLLKK